MGAQGLHLSGVLVCTLWQTGRDESAGDKWPCPKEIPGVNRASWGSLVQAAFARGLGATAKEADPRARQTSKCPIVDPTLARVERSHRAMSGTSPKIYLGAQCLTGAKQQRCQATAPFHSREALSAIPSAGSRPSHDALGQGTPQARIVGGSEPTCPPPPGKGRSLVCLGSQEKAT